MRTYGRMRHDPQLQAVIKAYVLPILRATWAVDGSGCRDEVVQQVAADLDLPILGNNDAPDTTGGARRRGVVWKRHLREALNALVYGHMPFERRYRFDDTDKRFHLDNLGGRMPWTLAQINLNHDASVKEIVQTTQFAPIPASRLAWYSYGQEGANWAGISVLRPAFGAWLLKHEIWRVHATSIRRFGMGIPQVTAPQGGTGAQVQEASRLASGFRAGDQSGVGLPQGFAFELKGMTGSVPDAVEFVKYLDQQMSKMALAGLVDLGQTEVGSRALGETFMDLFMLSLQAIAEEISITATSGNPAMPGIVTDLVDVNWGTSEAVPSVRCLDLGENHEITAQAIMQLCQWGALAPDPELDAWLRSTFRLPARSTPWPGTLPTPGAPALPKPGPPPAPAPADPVPEAPAPVAGSAAAARAALRWDRDRAVLGSTMAATFTPRRQLTKVEAAAGFEPDALRADLKTAVDSLITAWSDISRTQRNSLADQVTEIAASGKIAKLAALTVDTEPGAVLLATAMERMFHTAANRARREAQSQGTDIDIANLDTRPARMQGIADARSALAGQYVAAQASQKALQLVQIRAAAGDDQQPTEQQRDIGEEISIFLGGLSQRSLFDQLAAALVGAQNNGRVAVMQAGEAAGGMAVYTASEYNDSSCCQSCVAEDGTDFASLNEAEASYPTGGYINCEGFFRCRGTVIANWSGKDAL